MYKHLSNINQSSDWHWLVLKHAFGDLCSGTTYSLFICLRTQNRRYLRQLYIMRERVHLFCVKEQKFLLSFVSIFRPISVKHVTHNFVVVVVVCMVWMSDELELVVCDALNKKLPILIVQLGSTEPGQANAGSHYFWAVNYNLKATVAPWRSTYLDYFLIVQNSQV